MAEDLYRLPGQMRTPAVAATKHLPRALSWATGLLATSLAVTGCASEAAEGTGASELRVGPLQTQNTLTLALAAGRLNASVSEAGGTLTSVSPFPAFAPAAEAMAAGQVDMTSGSSTSLVTGLQGNPDLVVFAVERNDNDTQGIVAAPGTGIASVEDLRGRTVAVNEGGTGDYILRLALTKAGMTMEDVQPMYLGPADAATAFTSGQVDAWATWDQFLVSAQDVEGAKLVTLASDIGATNPTVHVVSRDFVEDNPEIVRAVYDALVAQAEEVISDPSVLRQAYIDEGATPEVANALVAKAPPTIVPADEEYLDELERVAEFYAEQGLTASVTDVSEAVVDVTELAS